MGECESGKCDLRKQLLIPDSSNSDVVPSRQEVFKRSKKQVLYGILYGETELYKSYTPEYYAEVRKNKNR